MNCDLGGYFFRVLRFGKYFLFGFLSVANDFLVIQKYPVPLISVCRYSKSTPWGQLQMTYQHKKVVGKMADIETLTLLVREPNSENCLDLIFAATSCEKVITVPNTNYITSAIRKLMLDMPSSGSFQNIVLLI